MKLQHSTSDFPYILQNIANKSLGVGYEEAPVSWRTWCGVGSLPDFKSASRVAVGDTDAFEVVSELMPITETTISEKRETRNLATYAKRFGISRQAIVNDDLDAFTRVPQLLGASAARTVNTYVYAQLTSPPTMAEDSLALFSATHTSGSNYTASSGGAPGITQLAKGLTLMRKQKGVGAKAYMNIVPKFIVAPPDLETAIIQLLYGSINPAQSSNVVPGWITSLVPVIEPMVSGSSSERYRYHPG